MDRLVALKKEVASFSFAYKKEERFSIDDLLRAREKEDGANFFGERSVVGGGSLARGKKDRFARRCDDAFC